MFLNRRIFTEDHNIFREQVSKFIEAHVRPNYSQWEKDKQIPQKVWLEAGKQGFLCPTAEEEFGGIGADFLFSSVISEELYKEGFSGLFIPLHNDVVFPYLQKYATKEQKQKWYPGCLSGEKILALALTEPNAGSDLAAMKTTAIKKGEHYILSGQKTFISNGQSADLIVVAARTGDAKAGSKGVSLFVVESGTKGFRRGQNLDKIGLHAQDTSELFFEDCEIPVGNLLGEEGAGFKMMMQSLQQERLVIAIGAASAIEGCLNLTLKYMEEREAFKKKLNEFQHLRFTMAELSTKAQLAYSFLDDLIPRHMSGSDLVKEVSMAKYWITDAQFEVADACLQIFGGYGYMQEYPISRHFVDARVQRIYGGTNEVMKELVARKLFSI